MQALRSARSIEISAPETAPPITRCQESAAIGPAAGSGDTPVTQTARAPRRPSGRWCTLSPEAAPRRSATRWPEPRIRAGSAGTRRRPGAGRGRTGRASPGPCQLPRSRMTGPVLPGMRSRGQDRQVATRILRARPRAGELRSAGTAARRMYRPLPVASCSGAGLTV